MGKKVKKDDKTPSEDTFDPLLVESKQAETVVLMLESPEDDVQNKACEAIYKFVSKCDENRQLLLRLGACDRLLGLLKSEEKIVRRNATMALAVMTDNNDVRKTLRTVSIAVPTFIKLLSTEEFTTTNEFAAMALCNLCQEYTSIAQVLKHNGIPSIVECLRSEDPDVQKNAVTCLDLVLRDFEARPLLKSCDGLVALLELTKSEFPIIQEATLRAFSKAVLDSGLRAIVREMDCLNRFVDIIGRSEFNDIHCICLQVIATCLEDIECVKQLKETGGLTRLLAFIADTQPPEDESKEKPKKSSKAGSAKKKKKDEDEKPKENEPSATLPEVKVQACRAIMKACKLDDSRRLLHECDAERLLVLLLSHESEPVRVAAAQAIGVMGQSIVCQNSIFDLGGIEQFVKLLKSDHKEMREAVTLALANLTTGNMKICQEISGKHGMEHLVNSLNFPQEAICSNALVAISNMSSEESLRSRLIQNGLIKALVTPLKSLSPLVQSKAALVTAAFLNDSKSRAEFRNNGGIPPLINLLVSNNADVRRAACWAVTIVAAEEESADALREQGALSILQEINKSETKRNKFSEAALNRLYDSNLNVKYALTGYLDFTDQIGDIFFDCGQMKPGTSILTLDQYGLEPINAKRPILLINATLPKPVTPVTPTPQENDDKKAADEKNSAKKRSSRKKDARRASNINLENFDETRISSGKGDETDTIVQVYNMPTDHNLIKYIEDVIGTVAPVPTVEEQVAELARYVSNCMGGPVSTDSLMSFPYELHISELKVEHRSNVIPIGSIKSGIKLHRALLFKFLADKLFLPTNLNRGEYNLSWNDIWIINKNEKPSKLNPKLYIIDLIHQPGRLILKDSPEGKAYTRL